MGEAYTVNSDISETAFFAYVRELRAEHKYLTFRWRIGPDRSLDQNALMHCWTREFVAHIVSCHIKEVCPEQIEMVKRELKGWCYRDTGESYLVYTMKSPLTGIERTGTTSSTAWSRGEMFHFLSWFQAFAAQRGLVLESRGEYQKLQREQNQ